MKITAIIIGIIFAILTFAALHFNWGRILGFISDEIRRNQTSVESVQMCPTDVSLAKRYVQVKDEPPQTGKNAPKTNGVLDSWVTWLLIFAFVDLLIALWASYDVHKICKQTNRSEAQKMADLKIDDIIFDLPLYVGLFGTVIGFILIAHGFASSRDAAYVSTVVGIIVSAMMRVCILRPAVKRIRG